MRRGVIALAMLVALAACGGGGPARPAERAPEPPPEALARDTEQGPVKARVQLWPTAPTLGDPIYLRLTIETRPGATASAPFDHEALGRFRVVHWTPSSARRDDGTMVETQTYTLEAPGSGKFRVPPLRVLVGAEELLTEELPLTVAPLDPARASEALAPARPALPATRTESVLPLWALAVVPLVGLVVAAVLVVGALRRRAVRQARVSAYDDAVARLAALEARGAPDPGAADAWFVELSAIVRRYLEGRYGVRAPELTTEEFLQEAQRAAGLTPRHRELLVAFLERCDRVKFAGYRPDADESLDTLRAARAFVEDTRVRAQEAA